MDWRKIQLTMQGTLNVTYQNDDADLVTVKGANIVRSNLRWALKALVPHLAILTEQREVGGKTLKELKADESVANDGMRTVFDKIRVDMLIMTDTDVQLQGVRTLDNGFTVRITGPKIDLSNADFYPYIDDLALAIEGVKFEAEEYWINRKWGIIQTTLDFKDDDPFAGAEVKAGEVPEITIDAEALKPKKRGRRKKEMQTA